MASQVTVIGPAARRHTVKTTPGTYLSDVLQQACTKFGLDAEQYGLKHNSKNVDASLTMRLSGLSGGAKLELTMLSKSPSVVNVALQLPSNARLTDKFPSITTLWLILRKFESGVAGGDGSSKHNFTARGFPKTAGEQGGSGRLYYEQPAIHIMGRDYANFTDLQKSLRQLGFNSGSVLLKLTYKVGDTPLEEAMEQIEQYFKTVETDAAPSYQAAATNPLSQPTPETTESIAAPRTTTSDDVMDTTTEDVPLNPEDMTTSTHPPTTTTTTETPLTSGTTTIANRATAIFRPPSSSTPQAAQTPHNPQDYVPTVEHARVHQASLIKAGQNTRLPTDAELEAQEAERAARKAAIDVVTIKARFPDESSAVADFGALDSSEDLYQHVEGMLRTGTTEPFEIAYAGAKGKVIPLPRNQQKLISQVGLEGKVLVQVRWMDGASAAARKGASLKDEVAGHGREVQVTKVPDAPSEGKDKEGKAEKLMNFLSGNSKDEGNDKGKAKGGVPKWFKVGKK